MWGHSSAYSSPQRLSSGLCELQYIGVFGEAVVCSETANYLVILTTAGLIRAPNYLLEKKIMAFLNWWSLPDPEECQSPWGYSHARHLDGWALGNTMISGGLPAKESLEN